MVQKIKKSMIVGKRDGDLKMFVLLVDGKPLKTVAYRIENGERKRSGNFSGVFFTSEGVEKFFDDNKLCDEKGKAIAKNRISVVEFNYKNSVSNIEPILYDLA